MKPTTDKERILRIIKRKARGHRNATHGWTITMMDRELVNLSDRQLRRLIRELVDDGHPIGSHPDLGYFWIVTPEDMAIAEAPRRCALDTLKRIAKVRSNYQASLTRRLPGIGR